MRILNEHSCFVIDGKAYEAFLRELEIPQEQIEVLDVCFVSCLNGARGDFSSTPLRIRLRTMEGDHSSSSSSVNGTLLHETRHLQIYCRNGRCYQPGEAKLPPGERPAEIDANRFAVEHQQRLFVKLNWSAQWVSLCREVVEGLYRYRFLYLTMIAVEWWVLERVSEWRTHG